MKATRPQQTELPLGLGTEGPLAPVEVHATRRNGRSDGTPHPPMLRKLLPPAQTGIRGAPFLSRDTP